MPFPPRFWLAAICLAISPFVSVRGADLPPPVEREFRGLWVATVNNIDWPSRPGLSSHEQKRELLAIFDRAATLHFNAIILQVRSGCDAIYPSRLEPWSEFLSGRMGQPPSPFYDPLSFAISEAHRRGLELHAWFNPYRAAARPPHSAISPLHVSVKHPELVRNYGHYVWLDPTLPAARQYSLEVILDVLRRYDVDGVHFDDYFYPYPEKGANGVDLPFPDDDSWHRYQVQGGKLSRGDWRRQNVNEFISAVAAEIKNTKPRVQFGVSPFGIWRSGHPVQISGFDAYDKLYCDSATWLARGWLDYIAPQLYWPVDQKAQSFPVLLNWWCARNTEHRNVFAGMRLTGWGGIKNAQAEEEREIDLTRNQPGASGEIIWHSKLLLRDEDGVADALGRGSYAGPALPPERPWVAGGAPSRPLLRVRATERQLKLKWSSPDGDVWLWLLQKRTNRHWTSEIFPAGKLSETLAAGAATPLPDEVAITAVNHYEKCGPPAVFSLRPRP